MDSGCYTQTHRENKLNKKHNRTTIKQEVREEKAGNTDVPNTGI